MKHNHSGGEKTNSLRPSVIQTLGSIWNHTNIYFYGLSIYKSLNQFHGTSSALPHKPNANISVSEATPMPRLSRWAVGSSGTQQAADFSQHLLWSDSWGTCYCLLKDLCLHILCIWYTATYRKGNYSIISFQITKKARRTRVFKRGCSVLSFSPALLVIQCRTLMNTIRCSPGNSAWIYFHQIEQHLMIPHHIQIGKPKANFFKKISLSLNFHRNI